MTDQELLNLKKSIESAKQKKSEVEGRKKALLETLNKEFGCKTIQEAENERNKLAVKVGKLEKEKQEKIDELERDYEF